MRETKDFIFFWGNQDVFSNWHCSPFKMNHLDFLNGEQAMMYEKAKLMGDQKVMKMVLAESNPREIKALGRKVSPWNEDLWIDNRLEIMTQVCFSKFSSTKNMIEVLKKTGNKILVEASPYDKIWGIGMKDSDPDVENHEKWRGLNLLGIALMNAREMI